VNELALAILFIVAAFGLGSYGVVMHRRRLALEQRRELARWIRETPFSERLALMGQPLTAEELAIMPREQIDELMRPEDMSQVRKEMEELESTPEFKEILEDAKRREQRMARPGYSGHVAAEQARLRASRAAMSKAAAAPTALTPQEVDALTDEEREILEQTEARRARR